MHMAVHERYALAIDRITYTTVNGMLNFAIQASSITRSSVRTSSMRSVIRDLETKEKGVDICIMMDGTGSMVCPMASTSHASCYAWDKHTHCLGAACSHKTA